MIVSPAFAGRKYAILGLARSGLAAAESLLASGAELLAWDRQDVARAHLEGRALLRDPMEADLTGYAGIVVSPGVPLNSHPIVHHAAQFGVPVIGDIELFAQARASLPPHKVVGITGTNGKSTTTALITHILAEAGVPARMGGNIGLPILAQQPLTPNDRGVGVYVLELSSYQIDLTQSLDCDVAVLLNVTPDHLDRYDGFEAYRDSKFRLFAMQSHDHVGVIAADDQALREMRLNLLGPGSWAQPGAETAASPPEQSGWPALQGPHNAQNVMAARAVAFELGIHRETVEAALRTFTSLPHRMERVASHNGVLFVNDSKATNTDSAAPALAAFPPDPAINGAAPRIHWIVGGLPKEDGLGACGQYLGNVAAAYTIGEAGPRFAELIEAGGVPVERSELLHEAARRAVLAARLGEVVLLSPACASFDQFRDFEVRGAHFRSIVEALTGIGAGIDGGQA